MGSRQLRPQFIRSGTAAPVDLLDLGERVEHVLGTFETEFWFWVFHWFTVFRRRQAGEGAKVK